MADLPFDQRTLKSLLCAFKANTDADESEFAARRPKLVAKDHCSLIFEIMLTHDDPIMSVR